MHFCKEASMIVYMDLPQGLQKQGEKKVYKLLKSLYGLKQASRQWNIKLTEALVKGGYSQSAHDHSLFTKKTGPHIVIIQEYVDDFLMTRSNIELIEEAKQTLHSSFKVKDLGELRYFLGIEVLRSKEGILLTQRKYALQLISEAGLAAAKPIFTPIELNQKLTTMDYDKHVGVKGYEELEDIGSYQRLIGKLLYLTITRPGLSFAVQDAALRVVGYVKSAPGLGILLCTGPINSISAYYDSDWASCPNTRRSVIGYIIKLGDSLLSWKSKKQQTVSQNSAEAEYRSLAAAAEEITWFLGLLKELQVHVHQPVPLHCDSKAALQIAANPSFMKEPNTLK
ncbi:uncharacterized mitochondrial protein AtMg00810-like [Nicotiana tomentosiformis]|uniref:uncharacterized mitochondrial protein AtMg00810-like n=1 Tax=Nicotiana tomentosiformis TaxID=4098 RepID=UPI00388C4B92